MKQRRKVRWSLFGISMLLILLTGVLGHSRTTGSKGSVSPATSAAPQIIAPPLEAHPWTAVASTGIVDEAAAIDERYAFGIPPVGGSAVGYHPSYLGFGNNSEIVLRYNVTNTFDNNEKPNLPNWKTLQLGSFAPLNSEVRATLYRVRICSGYQQLVCAAINAGKGEGCDTCAADALGDIDFGNFLYYVEVRLSRNDYSLKPRAHTLRLY